MRAKEGGRHGPPGVAPGVVAGNVEAEPRQGALALEPLDHRGLEAAQPPGQQAARYGARSEVAVPEPGRNVGGGG